MQRKRSNRRLAISLLLMAAGRYAALLQGHLQTLDGA